ncbi:hypothetical protein PS943_00855 [Pseudomonas fluorescens]|uniref:Uncharacterized protein n=1 Tax=Pseudomonas fluorescens TaxID=294 RepID=A0A5E7W0F3_PSEFL|nr:hypothetical protein PS943_00855 [Pseudomonas fluorescens]
MQQVQAEMGGDGRTQATKTVVSEILRCASLPQWLFVVHPPCVMGAGL